MQDFDLRKWRIKRGDILSIMSYPMHHDRNVYNTGSDEDPQPLKKFWANRFLVQKALGREAKPENDNKSAITKVSDTSNVSQEFSMKGLDGSWLPYGGGANICPGRQFAKQEILLNAALLLGNFVLSY